MLEQINLENKYVLDVTAGFRRMWLDHNQPNTIFLDKRSDEQLVIDWRARSDQEHRNRPNLDFNTPTFQGDFTHLPFPDETFYLVNFDPPQLTKIGKTSIYYKLYGALEPETWQSTLKVAAKEIWRVLKPFGVLTLKWNDRDIKVEQVLKLFPQKPLYGQLSAHGTTSNSHWFTFLKIPSFGGNRK